MTNRSAPSRENLGLHPRSFVRAVRWQLEDTRYSAALLRRMTPAERATLSRFNREFHGGRFAGKSEGADLQNVQDIRRERWTAKDAAERDLMSVGNQSGPLTDEMCGTCNPFED